MNRYGRWLVRISLLSDFQEKLFLQKHAQKYYKELTKVNFSMKTS